MRILIISIHSFKNLILASPLVSAIQSKYPHAEIHLLTSFEWESYVLNMNGVQTKYFLKGDTLPTIFTLLKIDFHHIINIDEGDKNYLIMHSLRNKFGQLAEFSSYPKGMLGRLFFKRKAFAKPDLATRFINTASKLHLDNTNLALTYCTSVEDNLHKDDIPTSHQLGFVAVSLVGLENAFEAIGTFCKEIKIPVALLGEEKHFAFAEKCKQLDIFKVYNACGKYTLGEQYNLILRANAFIGADNINLYQAAAAKKPIYFVGNKMPKLQDIIPYKNFSDKFQVINMSMPIAEAVRI